MNLQQEHGKRRTSKDKAIDALMSLKNSFHRRQATNKKEHLDADMVTIKGLNQTMSREDDAKDSEIFPGTSGKEEVSSPVQNGGETIQFRMRSSPSTSRPKLWKADSGLKEDSLKQSNTCGMRRRSVGAIGMNVFVPSPPFPNSRNVYNFTEASSSNDAQSGVKKENCPAIKPAHVRRSTDGMLGDALQTLGIKLGAEVAESQPCQFKLARRNSGYTMDTSMRGSKKLKKQSSRLVDYSIQRAPIQIEKTSPCA